MVISFYDMPQYLGFRNCRRSLLFFRIIYLFWSAAGPLFAGAGAGAFSWAGAWPPFGGGDRGAGARGSADRPSERGAVRDAGAVSLRPDTFVRGCTTRSLRSE